MNDEHIAGTCEANCEVAVGENPRSVSAGYNIEAKSASDVPVILIESSVLLRDELAKCLDSTRFRVIGSVASLGSLPSILDQPPELIVVGGSDLAIATRVIRECSERYPAARPVALGEYCAEYFTLLLRAGAHACIGRDITLETLVASLELVTFGVKFISYRDAPVARKNRKNRRIPRYPKGVELGLSRDSYELSEAQIAVIKCLLVGDSNKVISRKLKIADSTVKAHIKSILRKIHAANRTQAAIWAMTHLHTSTTLADSFTPQHIANPFSAVRAALRHRSRDEFEDSVSNRWQGWLRWWTADSFFSVLPL